MDLFRIFKRVITRITKREGVMREKVDDLPSSFLVQVAKLKKEDEVKFNSYLKSSGMDDDLDAAGQNANALVDYVGDLQEKGRNRHKIKTKGARARKAKTPAKGRKIAR